ncbi:MAG: tetratricopeptide repeat protein [Deltaproteobacteria bacterium]|nr:tetratricopeptide repeat protein [Deltaproteobacteria bacterium]
MRNGFIVLSILIVQLLHPHMSWANPPAESESLYKKQNEKELARLRQMSPEELKALDKKLSMALTYYYDRKFALALPLFREIAQLVQTMDILFWIGTCAMNLGKTELAIETFKKMLAVDPELHRVRLELASTYFSIGRYEDARRQLQRVKAASAPAEVQVNIEKLLAAIEERTRKTSINLRLSAGLLFDSNINAGPDQRELEVVGGTLTLDELSQQIEDSGLITDAYGNVVYDIGNPHGLMWNTAGNFFNRNYLNYSQFNFMLVTVTTGPWWVGRRDILKVPFGLMHAEYGSDRLYYGFTVSPNYEYHFGYRFSLKGGYQFKTIHYYEFNNSELDNRSHRFELKPSLYFSNRRHILSAVAGYETSDADSSRWSYDTPLLGVFYIGNFPTKTDLFLSYLWIHKEYDDPPILYDAKRKDRRHTFSIALSQRFYKHLFWSVAFGYMDNDSNTELFEFDQKTFSISFGFLF